NGKRRILAHLAGGCNGSCKELKVALARVTRWGLYTFVIPGPPTRSGSGTRNRWLCASGVVQRRRRWAARSKRDVAAGHWAKPIPDRATRVRNDDQDRRAAALTPL